MSATREPLPRFEILPAIDIRAGRVVDLFQGDYSRETVYDDAAEAVMERFIRDGARWIHVVDLDGSRGGSPANRDLVRALARMAGAAGVRVQLGGGIRSLDAAHTALESGVSRVIFGTAAVERPDVVEQAVRRFGPAAVAVGIDARRGLVATRGWTETAPLPAVELARRMVACGVAWLIYTDVERDSTLTEPNFAELERLRRSIGAAVIASGGVTTVEQIHRLAALGLAGAIIGSAIYSGRLGLRQALAAAAVAPEATDPAAIAGGRPGIREPGAEPGRK